MQTVYDASRLAEGMAKASSLSLQRAALPCVARCRDPLR